MPRARSNRQTVERTPEAIRSSNTHPFALPVAQTAAIELAVRLTSRRFWVAAPLNALPILWAPLVHAHGRHSPGRTQSVGEGLL
jgi:hypothetical protein